MIDDKTPPSFIHLRERLKKREENLQRQKTIEKANHILVERIARIMHHKRVESFYYSFQQRRLAFGTLQKVHFLEINHLTHKYRD